MQETPGSISNSLWAMTSSNRPIRAPDLIELETLVACAAEGSLGGAGARLGISRPAVAKRIKNLEAIAGQSLLHRGARGVRLTDAGATLLAGARRLLHERDRLVGVLGEMRGEGPSAIAGLRQLLGHAPDAARAAQQSEARLAETERVLERVLRASATGVAISDPETAIIHEANDAFCRFVGRTRAEVIGRPATDTGAWYDDAERPGLVAQLRREGTLDRVFVRVKRPDGTVRAGETSVSFISLAGTTQMLSTIDDVTETRRAALERDGSLIAYREVARLAAYLLAGRPIEESVARMLPALRSCGEFASALLWSRDTSSPVSIDGEAPDSPLADSLAEAQTSHGQVTLLSPGGRDSPEIGFALPLPATGCVLVLLSARPLPDSAKKLTADMLEDIAAIVSAASSPAPAAAATGGGAR
jgi:PAS domain S-box-containing protein